MTVDVIQAVEEEHTQIFHPVHLHDLLKMAYLKSKILDDMFALVQDYCT